MGFVLRRGKTITDSAAQRVRFAAMKKKPRIIAGLDCAFSKDGK